MPFPAFQERLAALSIPQANTMDELQQVRANVALRKIIGDLEVDSNSHTGYALMLPLVL